jgi:hypothetical protein
MALDKTRPKNVSTAIKLLYLSLILGIINSVLVVITLINSPVTSLPSAYLGITTGITIFILFVTLALLAFFIYKIGKGKNWARILYLILFLIGIPSAVINLIQFFTTWAISGIIGFCEIILDAVAVILLFQKSSSAWFNLKKKAE